MNARDKILKYMKDKGEPVSTKELSDNLGLPKNTVYYSTTVLVAGDKIERYLDIAGIFILKEKP